MKLVTWKDERGYQRQAWVPDHASEADGPSGIPHEPPDLSEIDWEDTAREIHNALVAQGLNTWQDVMRQQTTFVPIIVGPVKKRILALYRKKYEKEI